MSRCWYLIARDLKLTQGSRIPEIHLTIGQYNTTPPSLDKGRNLVRRINISEGTPAMVLVQTLGKAYWLYLNLKKTWNHKVNNWSFIIGNQSPVMQRTPVVAQLGSLGA